MIHRLVLFVLGIAFAAMGTLSIWLAADAANPADQVMHMARGLLFVSCGLLMGVAAVAGDSQAAREGLHGFVRDVFSRRNLGEFSCVCLLAGLLLAVMMLMR